VKNEILNELKLIICELDGHLFSHQNPSKSINNVRLIFLNKQVIVEDELFFLVDFTMSYGISFSSKLFNKNMSFNEYVYNLVQKLEMDFCCYINLKPTTAKHFFQWEKQLLKIKKIRYDYKK
jgi:hypothetical protein